jgi:two-component system invasion response regulator UvrY
MPGAILIVDDNFSIRRVLRSALERDGGCKVCGEAENGSVALSKVRELHPDLVVVDFSMPVMNGLEVIRVLKRECPGMPVILFTMFKDTFLEAEAFAAGASVVISKAAGVNALIEQTRVLLKYSRPSWPSPGVPLTDTQKLRQRAH